MDDDLIQGYGSSSDTAMVCGPATKKGEGQATKKYIFAASLTDRYFDLDLWAYSILPGIWIYKTGEICQGKLQDTKYYGRIKVDSVSYPYADSYPSVLIPIPDCFLSLSCFLPLSYFPL